MSEVRIDALLPQEMATRVEYLGVRKAEMPFLKMFMLAVLAGAFISLGAIFATTVGAGSMAVVTPAGETAFTTGLPYGFNRLLVGLVFSLGLILVVVGGAELFTGNNLIVMAWANGKVRGRAALQLDHRLSGKFRRFHRDRDPDVPDEAIHLRRGF
jgi:formate transporter